VESSRHDESTRSSRPPSQPPLEGGVDRLPRVASVVLIAIGLLVLFGWALDLDALKRVAPGHVAMTPNTATCFLLAGIGLWLQSLERRRPRLRAAARGIGAFLTAVGLLVLSQDATFSVLSFELVQRRLGREERERPGDGALAAPRLHPQAEQCRNCRGAAAAHD